MFLKVVLFLLLTLGNVYGLLMRSGSPSLINAAPVIVLHGLLGSSRNFRSWVNNVQGFLNDLDRKQEIICCDMRCHGKNAGTGNSITYEEMAKDIFDTMDSMGARSAHLVGHSMGGKVAAAVALLQHSRGIQIDSVTMLDISPVPYTENDFDSVIRSVRSLKSIYDEYLIHQDENLLRLRIAREFPDVGMQRFMQSSVTSKNGQLHWNFDIPSIHKNLLHIAGFPFSAEDTVDVYYQGTGSESAKRWKPFAGPVLILKGEQSDFVQDDHHVQTRALFPNHRVASIAGAGHWVHIDAPEESARKVAEFIHTSSAAFAEPELATIADNFA